MAMMTKRTTSSNSGDSKMLSLFLAIFVVCLIAGYYVWELPKTPQPVVQKYKYMVHCSESVRVEYIATVQLPIEEVCR